MSETRIAVLDDYQGVALDLRPDWSPLERAQAEVVVFSQTISAKPEAIVARVSRRFEMSCA